MTYEKVIFEAGKSYIVKQNLASGLSQFLLNEVLIFERGDYSPYDNCFLYTFKTGNGQSKIWWLHEDQASDKWRIYFEPMQ
jgi:hypothetical protein